MAREKLKLIYLEEAGKPLSYRHLSNSESERAIKIVEKMRRINGWIPLSQLSSLIESPRHSTTRTVDKLIGAKRIEPAKYNLTLLIKNRSKNPKANYTDLKFLKPTTYLCAHQWGHTHK